MLDGTGYLAYLDIYRDDVPILKFIQSTPVLLSFPFPLLRVKKTRQDSYPSLILTVDPLTTHLPAQIDPCPTCVGATKLDLGSGPIWTYPVLV